MEIPPKLAPGKSGKPIKLISNYFSVDVPTGEIYHYDLEIEPFHNTKEKKRKIVSTLINTDKIFKNRPAVFDGGANLYTKTALDIGSELRCQVVLGDVKFSVRIRPVVKNVDSGFSIKLDPIHAFFSDEVSSVPQEAIMVLEAVLRFGPSLNYLPINRLLFYPPPPTNICPLSGGINIWTGHRQSLRLGQCQLLLNLDVKGGTFYPERPLLDYFAAFLNVPQLSDDVNITKVDIMRISNELRGMKVKKTRLKFGSPGRVQRLTDKSAKETKISEEANITVADFFAERDGPLKYPNLPCVEVVPKRGLFPLEVCETMLQSFTKRLNDRQSSELIKFTSRSPKQKFDGIIESFKKCNEFKDTYLKEFDIKLQNELLKLEGRIIDAPKLSYQKEKAFKPKDGCWNMKNKQFFRASSVDSWIVISFANCASLHLESFTKLLFDIAIEHGMKMRPVKNICIVCKRKPVKDILNEMFQEFKTDLMVVVLPERNKTMYIDVKEFSKTKSGLVTQCVMDVSVSKKCKPSVLSNICQKINAKMGGINTLLEPDGIPFLLQRPVITIGANVLHEYQEYGMGPHLATVVGSLDVHLSKYAVKHSLQYCRYLTGIPYILDLTFMIIDLLKAFYCNNRGKKPEKIIFFRAGVCDSQFESVKSHEVQCIREACLTLNTAYCPGITYIALQKRHHTRFAPQDCRHGVGRMGNIPPGTVVDSDVVRPSGFDFFLCSHFVTQGTSVPRHYTVLEDDNQFTADELEKLTYYLCHAYAFCTKSLSCPAPIRYAQLAAQRTRQWLSAKLEKLNFEFEDYDKMQPIVEELRSTMFFI
ncbi:Protein argonaute-2 [Araneus ventricosus]|uniref:Protein argonaute-2 n=1 Tax=Araneus ventricosus TaxID=182803 RepID=A0A4Y2JZC2_ARAVE|nr:Protein argonaute-2 [Araneus ventricosus]